MPRYVDPHLTVYVRADSIVSVMVPPQSNRLYTRRIHGRGA